MLGARCKGWFSLLSASQREPCLPGAFSCPFFLHSPPWVNLKHLISHISIPAELGHFALLHPWTPCGQWSHPCMLWCWCCKQVPCSGEPWQGEVVSKQLFHITPQLLSLLSPFSWGSFLSMCRDPEQQHWLIRPCIFCLSEASNLAVDVSQTGTEFMFSFKICCMSWWKHSFVRSKTYSPSTRACSMYWFFSPQFGSLLIKRRTFYFCAYGFYYPHATHNILPHNIIKTAEPFIKILSSKLDVYYNVQKSNKNKEIPLQSDWYLCISHIVCLVVDIWLVEICHNEDLGYVRMLESPGSLSQGQMWTQ